MHRRILNVAEKNDAAKSLSRIMSRGNLTKKEGLSKYNKIFEFDFNILNSSCRMVMTSVSGHLLSMDFLSNFQKWNSCLPVELFEAQVQKFCTGTNIPIKKTLEREIRNCNTLIIWTDGDREGENIGHEIISVCKAVKPRIEIHRARFSEITYRSIMRACENLTRPDNLQSDAVDVRQELDLRIGAAFTRFQTLRLQRIFAAHLKDQLISYGSCQFPTLGFVVSRFKEIDAFISEDFYKIKVTLDTEDGVIDFNWKRVRLFYRHACEVIHQICLENPLATVTSVVSKPKSKWRPLPLDTVEFEKLVSRKLKIGAKEAMKIAEKLYNRGFISYPRTETNQFPSSMNLRQLIEYQTESSEWGDFAKSLVERGPTPRWGKKTDNAHPPIHPTKFTNTLQGNEKRIYELVVRHFLACCSQDAEGSETIVEITIARELFAVQGLIIIAKNYLEVYPYDRWSDKPLPAFVEGQQFQPTNISMVEGRTEPPPLLTESNLIDLMDKNGIGTDATHAEHIETIKARKYVAVQNGRFVPGELGIGLVEGYDSMGFEMSKPKLRAELEAGLKRICEGTRNKTEVLQEQITKYKEVFVKAAAEATKLDVALSKYLINESDQIMDNFQGKTIYSKFVNS
ncbi:uncharacterized protein TRIADDRAFT_22834 [Trichoplax adhaerens]|uniref:DNA topoisomerase n=1 Tax=Trichoplax adhaerens TaxID=10228 RepID=B3RSB2_TRIAD|nr:hypothetical protein TRIADDRAFT_22834 [Trichoplax adhaerens]EDV27024.1 hypothetical protein TRIADDRAFT_22834 [Trichoplax adhaerens]|eukprot:XP_002111020.1 hypothetical protein TRIADDRAFT_22834 [Trichoplax adhaerens]